MDTIILFCFIIFVPQTKQPKIMLKKKNILLILGLLLSFGFNLSAANSETPNVVIIYVDDLGYGDLSCYGATEVQTPHVDALANKGILFTDAHCSSATCTPSRYSLLTGNFAFRVKAAVLQGDAPALIRPETPTIASMLKSKGYHTAVIGKWHLGLGNGDVDWNNKVAPGPLEIGFDYSYLIPATGDRVPCVMLENHHVVNLDPMDPITVSYKGKVGTDPTAIEHPEMVRYAADDQHGETIVNGVSRIGHMTGGNAARWRDETVPYLMLSKARTFIDESKNDPFFLYFAFHDIHVPRLPDHQFQGATDLGVRGDAIVQMDYITGQLVDYLKQKGQLEKTIIVFSSDNGPVINDGYEDEAVERLGNHKPGGVYRGGKYSNFEAGTRVPTIVHYPARIKEAQKSDALMSHTDLYASIASLVDHKLKDNEALDSYDFLSTWLGESDKGREYLLEEAVNFSLRTPEWKYIKPAKNAKQGSWIGDVKDIESGVSIEDQLYRVSEDPAELNNLATKKHKQAKRMAEKLEEIVSSESTRLMK